VDKSEAERVEDVVRSLQSYHESLEGLGVCRLHSRGRTGEEVAAWDIPRLLTVAQPLTPIQRSRLFGQVAWRCEGAGQERFVQALERYIVSSYMGASEDRNWTRNADMLLRVLGHLPPRFEPFRRRVAVMASGVSELYGTAETFRSLAHQAHLHSKLSYARFRGQIDATIADLTREQIHLHSKADSCGAKLNRFVYPEDEFVQGAIIVCIKDRKVQVGLIVGIEQQAWNAAIRGWDKTAVVRFAEGERRMNPYSRTNDAHLSKQRVMVLVPAPHTISMLQKIRDHLQTDGGTRPLLRPLDQAS